MKSTRRKVCDFFRSIQVTWTRRCTRQQFRMQIPRRSSNLSNRRMSSRKRSPQSCHRHYGYKEMIAADSAVQRPPDAKLLVVDSQRNLIHVPRTAFVEFLRPNDLVMANDAATLPASLSGVHQPTGKTIEVRLAGRPSLNPMDVKRFSAIVFGEGDFHLRTEDRPLPPPVQIGDVLVLGPLHATVES